MKLILLFIMAVLSFVAMYLLMYMMVDSYGNVYGNLNQFYMAAVMTATMMLIEMAVMKSMYGRKVKIAVTGISIMVLILFFSFLREQVAVSDKEFLKSMIPHHGAALLMCEKAELKDPEIKELCQSIISSQQEQIDWMKIKLRE